MPDTPTLVLAVECPHCAQLSRLSWYQSLPVLPPRCQGCGRAWTPAQVDALAAQIPPAQAALARALAGENPAPQGANVRQREASGEVPTE
jgi:hypothetical protein